MQNARYTKAGPVGICEILRDHKSGLRAGDVYVVLFRDKRRVFENSNLLGYWRKTNDGHYYKIRVK